MLRLISDADVHRHIVHGVRRRLPCIDLVRVQEVGLRTATDPVILEWAAAENRIVISQDHSTMIGFARDRIVAGLPMPGLFVLRQRATIGQAIDALVLVDQCSQQGEWQDRIELLPV
jgi:predicted nuclease of predicted toxin-antitoxin system